MYIELKTSLIQIKPRNREAEDENVFGSGVEIFVMTLLSRLEQQKKKRLISTKRLPSRRSL